MDLAKLPNMIHISGCSSNVTNLSNLQSWLQHSLNLDIDIQCYSKVNTDFMKANVCHNFMRVQKCLITSLILRGEQIKLC